MNTSTAEPLRKKRVYVCYDGYISFVLLLLTPIGGDIFGSLLHAFNYYRGYGQLFGGVLFYSFSIGFAISAFRQPGIGGKVFAVITLLSATIGKVLLFPEVSS